MTAATSEPASTGPSTTVTHESTGAADRADPSGVLHALARILEHAHGLLAEGYSPRVAILAALDEHRPQLDLALVAQVTWALVLNEGLVIGPPHDDGTSTVAGAPQGGS